MFGTHKARDDPMEHTTLVVQRLARRADALLASAQRAEVLDCLGHGLAVQTHDNAPGGLAANVDVEPHLVGHWRMVWWLSKQQLHLLGMKYNPQMYNQSVYGP